MSGFMQMLAFQERKIAATFLHAGAVNTEHARSPSELGLEIASLNALRARGVLRDGPSGRIYLDEESFATMTRLHRLAIMALIISTAGVVLAIWGFLRRR